MGARFSAINQRRAIRTKPQLDEAIDLFLSNRNHQAMNTSVDDHDQLVSTFLEIAVGQTVETATNFLQTTNWKIDEAINLFLHNHNHNYVSDETIDDDDDDDYSASDEEESDSRLNHPLDLLFEGSFQDAKSVSCERNLWLLVNLQSKTELASHTLNQDVWSNAAVSEAVASSFMLWQVYDHITEGKKISSFYKIESVPPVVLLIDPITGQKMHMWNGVIEAQSFVEDLMKFMDAGPHEYIASLTRKKLPEKEDACSSSNFIGPVPAPSWGEEFEESAEVKTVNSSEKEEICSTSNEVEEEETCFEFPLLTEEPKGDCDRSLVCSLCVRFPDGKRKQRRFLKNEPIQLLWSFCYSHMEESEKRPFKLVQTIPGASKTLDYEANATFCQFGLDNSLILVTWE